METAAAMTAAAMAAAAKTAAAKSAQESSARCGVVLVHVLLRMRLRILTKTSTGLVGTRSLEFRERKELLEEKYLRRTRSLGEREEEEGEALGLPVLLFLLLFQVLVSWVQVLLFLESSSAMEYVADVVL